MPGTVEVEHELEPDAIAGVDATRLLQTLASDDEPPIEGVIFRTALVLAPEDTLGEAAEKLLAEEARAAIVGEFGRVVGILTGSDLLRAAAARSHPAEARVRQWMTAEPVTVPPDASVIVARTLMEQYGVDQLPVVEGDTVLGLVQREQLERVLVLSPGLGF